MGKHNRCEATEEEMIQLLGEFAEETGSTTLEEFKKYDSEIRYYNITYRFGSWNEALTEAGISERRKGKYYSKDDIISSSQRFYEKTESTSVDDYLESDEKFSFPVIKDYFGSWGNLVDEAGIPHEFVECPGCGDLYNGLGHHWTYEEDCRPEITDEQWDIIEGLMMGDASAVKNNKNVYIQCNMTEKKFLDWIDEKLGALSRGVWFHESAKERATKDRETGWNPGAKEENYNDQYKIETRGHPAFNKFRDWYPHPRKKKFPEDIDLTPLKFKVWYCCDGSIKRKNSKRRNPYISISSTNEAKSDELFEEIFSDIPVSPSIIKHNRDGRIDGDLRFTVEETEWLWSWMGGSLPGFREKWLENVKEN